jgi:decaprenylphospho-beta-D-erythro-pentofuranosid-2-ulose 2-reductase
MSARELERLDATRRVLVLGGTSEIAAAILSELPPDPDRAVVLAGRDPTALARAAEGLRSEGVARVETVALEADELEAHRARIAEAFELLGGGVDLVVLAVGVLGERGGLPEDIAGAVEVLRVNVLDAGSLLLHSASLLREHGGGTIVVLSSVAAERPRAANAVYCASKAGIDSLAQGLDDALAGSGVRVMVVRPGFVRGRMTAGLRPSPLASTPGDVARETVRGLRRGARTVWVPGRIRWVMVVLRLLPRAIFRRFPA